MNYYLAYRFGLTWILICLISISGAVFKTAPVSFDGAPCVFDSTASIQASGVVFKIISWQTAAISFKGATCVFDYAASIQISGAPCFLVSAASVAA